MDIFKQLPISNPDSWISQLAIFRNLLIHEKCLGPHPFDYNREKGITLELQLGTCVLCCIKDIAPTATVAGEVEVSLCCCTNLILYAPGLGRS